MSQPIGIFDSGLGGLLVLKELATHFPGESFIYLGDTARIPYGSKSPSTIEKYAQACIQFLSKQDVKAIIVACNTASSGVDRLKLKETSSLPIYTVIAPGAEKAVRSTQNKRIGIIGTRATIEQKSYENEILKRDPSISVTSQACPLFVPLVEEGWDDDPITNLIVFRYIQPLIAQNIDTLVLGCTHYPFLKKAIEKVTNKKVNLIDSSSVLIEELNQDFASKKILKSHRSQGGGLQILATDINSQFEKLSRRLLDPIQFKNVELVDV